MANDSKLDPALARILGAADTTFVLRTIAVSRLDGDRVRIVLLDTDGEIIASVGPLELEQGATLTMEIGS